MEKSRTRWNKQQRGSNLVFGPVRVLYSLSNWAISAKIKRRRKEGRTEAQRFGEVGKPSGQERLDQEW